MSDPVNRPLKLITFQLYNITHKLRQLDTDIIIKFLLSRASRSLLGLTQPPGVKRSERKADNSPPISTVDIYTIRLHKVALNYLSTETSFTIFIFRLNVDKNTVACRPVAKE